MSELTRYYEADPYEDGPYTEDNKTPSLSPAESQNKAEETYSLRPGEAYNCKTQQSFVQRVDPLPPDSPDVQILTTSGFSINTLPSDCQPSEQEVAKQLEEEHVVKTLPPFSEQANDAARQNMLTIIGREPYTLTEYEVLRVSLEHIRSVLNKKHMSSDGKEAIESIMKNTSFIGEREFREATSGLAIYWKELLKADPGLHLIIEGLTISEQEVDTAPPKSD